MEPIESEGHTVAEAVEAALRRCGLRREQVEVDVLQEGSAGFMGLGAKLARVRLTEKHWGPSGASPTIPSSAPAPRRNGGGRSSESRPTSAASRPFVEARPPRPSTSAAPCPLTPAEASDACAKAQQLVMDTLRLMGIAAPTVTAIWDADLERVKAVVESQDATLLTTRDGRALESLQFLATLMLSRGTGHPIAVQVDALSYWEKREQAILDEARNAIESVKATGRPYRLEPMDAAMRRLVHRSFASHPDVITGSEGEGPWRKIVIRPRKP